MQEEREDLDRLAEAHVVREAGAEPDGVEPEEPPDSDLLVWTQLGGQNFSFRVEAEKTLRSGEPIRIGFDPARASLFDSQSGNRM